MEDEKEKKLTIEELSNFCKRKGFIFRSSDIYGGLAGFWDFGPLGVELFKNIKEDWWQFFVNSRENIFGIEASIISHPKTWQASGHIENFNDVSVKCKSCKKFSKVDKFELNEAKCSFCNGDLDISTAKDLNLMFKTKVGPIEEDSIIAYLRPETAQGMFLNFKLIQQTSRAKLPFGIAQIGRCFRNEIAPRDFLFRCREFNIGEFEFFVNPEEKNCPLIKKEHLDLKLKLLTAEDQATGKNKLTETTIGEMIKQKKLEEWHAYWLAEQIIYFKALGLEKIKVREHMKKELSHYSSATFDIDYEYPFGSKELAGIANRGIFDLTQHQKFSGEKMEIYDEKYNNKVIPKVIEPTFGMERIFLAIISNAYTYDKKRENIVLKLPPRIAPIKAAVFPLIKEEKLERIAKDIVIELRKKWKVTYDISGSIGRRYSRNDEIGTPMCITIDEDTLKDNSVTIRDRDTTEQVRVEISKLKEVIQKVIEGESLFSLCKKVETRKK